MDSVGSTESIADADCLVADFQVAVDSVAPTLITGSTGDDVERVARLIHGVGRRGGPFIGVAARTLPNTDHSLAAWCAEKTEEAAGGTLLLANVSEMPCIAQERLFETLTDLRQLRETLAPIRLMAGTTAGADLLQLVAAGTFSRRLFYRLNVIHLVVSDDATSAAAVPARTAIDTKRSGA